MVPLNTKIKLIISDPWDRFKIVIGMVSQTHVYNRETYLLIKDLYSPDEYLVSSRHFGFDASQVMEQSIGVAIGIPKTALFSFDVADFESLTSYYGIGSIEVIDDP